MPLQVLAIGSSTRFRFLPWQSPDVESYHWITLTPGRSPIAVDAGAIAITPDGKTAYAVTLDNSTLTPIDLTTGTVGTPITVGTGQDAIAITPDGKTAYVASIEKNTVTPIDLTTGTVGTPITVGKGPVAIAITRRP